VKLRVIALGTLLVVLAGTAANANDRTSKPNDQTNVSVTCCDPPSICGRKCPPVK